MRSLYRTVNGMLLLLGILLCTFCSNATIGSPDSLQQAAETAPWHLFFVRTTAVMLALLAYAGLVSGLNRFVFYQVAHPAKVFWMSVGVYLTITVVLVYFFIQSSLNAHYPL